MIVGATAAMAEFDYTQDITVVSRERTAAARAARSSSCWVLEKEDENRRESGTSTTEEAVITNSTNVMMTTVAGNEAAIGYSSMGSLNESVKALQVNGVAATVENIKAGTYEVARPFNIATMGEVSEAAQDFITYILSRRRPRLWFPRTATFRWMTPPPMPASRFPARSSWPAPPPSPL